VRILLTDRFVAGAKADSTRPEFFDSRVKGLSLRVSPSAKTWAFHFTDPVNGKRARLTLGTFPAMTLAAARGAALEARADVESGQDPRAHKAGTMTVATLAAGYLAKHVRPNLRSARQFERRLAKNVIPQIGSVRLADLHRRDINRVLDAIVGRHRPIEANRVFGDIRAMLRWAVARGDLDRDPTAGMAAPSPPRSRDRVLSEAEIAQFWTALPTALPKSVNAQRILRLCLITAQRVGEVAGLERSELDLKARTWTIPAARAKNANAHTVPLSDIAIAILEEALANAGNRPRLFDVPAIAIARWVGRAQTQFGISPGWTPHDLRRSAITHMAELGTPPVVLGHVANHRSVTKAGVTLAVYSRYTYAKETRQALNAWADRLTAVIGARPTADVVPMGRAR
jgi:integrase